MNSVQDVSWSHGVDADIEKISVVSRILQVAAATQENVELVGRMLRIPGYQVLKMSVPISFPEQY